MPSPWLGIEIGLRSLRANQRALEITGHNVANVHTEGYSRQAPVFETTPALDYPVQSEPGQIGTGVHIARANRYREMFLDLQYRKHSANHTYSKTLVDFYDQLEGIWQEPSDHNLRAHLDRFWDALQDLANRPGAYDARVTVIESGKAMVQVAKSLHQQMADLGQSLDDRIRAKVTELNRMAHDVAELNEQIARIQARGQTAHDLEDKRDLLLDQMAALAGVRWEFTPTGRVTVYIGTHRLVNGAAGTPNPVDEIQAVWDSSDGPYGRYKVQWTSDGTGVVSLTSGELSALLRARTVTLAEYQRDLEALVGQFMWEFNKQHKEGYVPGTDPTTGQPLQGGIFFDGVPESERGKVDWAKLAVAVDASGIAAAGTAEPGVGPAESDGENARLLVALFDKSRISSPRTGNKQVTVGAFYRTVEGALGVEARKERSIEQTFRFQVEQAKVLRESMSGVTLDEETARMIQYQQAYAAAARLITTVDQMLDKLINGTGVVGR